MGLFEHWPYTNFHDLNLNWIIGKIKNVETSEAAAGEYAEASAESAAASQLSADASQTSAENAQQYSNDSQEAAAASASSAQESQEHAENTAETATEVRSEMTTLNTRMDNIIASGTPTEGNAELLDLRVGTYGSTYTTAGKAVRDQFAYLSKEINLINENVLIDNKYYDPNTGAVTDGNNTTQLVPLIPVETGRYYFYTNFEGSQVFSFVIFDANQDYVRNVPAATIRFTSPIIDISDNEKYVGITLYNTQLDNKTAFVKEKYSGYFRALQSALNVIPPHVAVKNDFSKNTVIVDKHGNGDFTTINDAIAAITDDSAAKPYTVFIKSGVYNEVVSIQGARHISLIGENVKDCIIRNDTGLYENCPIQIGGDFLLENLTVIATHDGNPSMPHTGNKAYGMHIDYPGAGVGIVKNCRVFSYQSSAIGAGLHANQTLIIDNCYMESFTPNGTTWDPESDWTTTPSYGALYVHANTSANVQGQKLIIKDCMITSANKRNCAFASSPDGTSNMEINMIRNNFWCADGNADSTVTEWYSPTYTGRSHGNNIAKFNA